MENCQDCGHEFDPNSVEVHTPIPNNVCFRCGSELSESEIAALIELSHNSQN